MADKITSDDIRKALADRYREPEWYLGFEVGNGCGANVTRHADAIAINQWPHKGHEVVGIEIKVSKSDLKRELEIGAKSEALAQYCNYWYLVVPKGLTDGINIPEPWGIIEYIDGKLRQKKKAAFFKNTIDIGFCCAFIRGIRRKDEKDLKEAMAYRERMQIEHLDMEVRNKLYDYEKLQERLEMLKKRTGIDLTNRYWLNEYEINAMALAKRLLASHDDIRMICSVKHLTSDLAEVTDWITKTIGELQKFVDLMNGGEKK